MGPIRTSSSYGNDFLQVRMHRKGKCDLVHDLAFRIDQLEYEYIRKLRLLEMATGTFFDFYKGMSTDVADLETAITVR